MFDEIAPVYDKLNHLFTFNIDRRWRKDIIKFLKNKQVNFDNILDIASGTGDLTKELLKLDPSELYSTDISEKMLMIQKNKISDNRLTIVHEDVLELSFPEKSFDLVTIGFGIRNFEDIVKSLKNIGGVMKKGSILVILEMFRSTGLKTNMFNFYFGKVMPFIGKKISGSGNAYSYLFDSVNTFYTVEDFIELCKENGFELHFRKNNFLGIVNTVYLEKK